MVTMTGNPVAFARSTNRSASPRYEKVSPIEKSGGPRHLVPAAGVHQGPHVVGAHGSAGS